MTQHDWVGNVPRKPFKDIRNTRESVAEQKARLALDLGALINTIPPEIKTGGSVNLVRIWRQKREAAAKIAAGRRSSVQDLQYAIRCMQNWNKDGKPA